MSRLKRSSGEPRRGALRNGIAMGLAIAALIGPAAAFAHERWVAHQLRFPVNHRYFQSMTGEVLLYSAGATMAVLSIILFWYFWALGIVDELTPVTAAARAQEAERSLPSRAARWLARFLLDGDVENGFMERGLTLSALVFDRLPALVLVLGVIEGWLIMPSFPIRGVLGPAIRIAAAGLALWVASGVYRKPLGAAMLLAFAYLCIEYGIVAVDAVPVLASAFFYLFCNPPGKAPHPDPSMREGHDVQPALREKIRRRRLSTVNARQLWGVRLALGIGFFLLGLVNKIYLAEIFIGVGDQHPSIIAGPQAMFPGLTREAWSFTTALGEMVFGLLLLTGVFNRLTTFVLSLVFANFMVVFGWPEVVHIYPIAGLALLFFRGTTGTSLDGLVFRANLQFWRRLHHGSARVIYGSAVSTVAALVAVLLLFIPLALTLEVVPRVAGTAVLITPHSDHEPHHGGLVTMAGDVHVEIVVRSDGAILCYPSDEIRRPIPLDAARGTVQVERAGQTQTISLAPSPSGALIGQGPVPAAKAHYTYALQVRGDSVSMTIVVPAGGTDLLVRSTGGAG